MEGAAGQRHRAAIQSELVSRSGGFDSLKEYRKRLGEYAAVEGARRGESRKTARKATALACIGGEIYMGTRTGEIFVYSEALAFKEQFRAEESAVVRMKAFGDKIGILHANGAVAAVGDKKGKTWKISGYREGVFHPYLPLVISGTEGGIDIFDMEEGKAVCARPKESGGSGGGGCPIDVHPCGSCVLFSGDKSRLVDIRTMEVVGEVGAKMRVLTGIFHSSGVEMAVGARNRGLSVFDTRNFEEIRQIGSSTATALCEFKSAIFYTGCGIGTRGVCPSTGKELFRADETGTAFGSEPETLYVSDENRNVHRYCTSLNKER